MILLDTNIIVYSLDVSSSKNSVAKRYIKNNAINLVLAHQNVNEAIRIMTHPKHVKPMTLNEAITAVTAISQCLTMIIPKEDTIFVTLELLKKYQIKSNEVFDAYLAATMLSNDIYTIATDNVKDFSIFEGIKVINPFS